MNDQPCNLKWQGICDLLVELGYPSRDKNTREARYRTGLKDDNLESLQEKCNDFEKGRVLKFYSNQQRSYLLNEIKKTSDIDQQFTDKFNKKFNDNRSRYALIALFNYYILNKSADSFESKEGEYEYDHENGSELMDITAIVNTIESTLSSKGIAYHFHCPFCRLRFKFSSSYKVHTFGNKVLESACQEIKVYQTEYTTRCRTNQRQWYLMRNMHYHN